MKKKKTPKKRIQSGRMMPSTEWKNEEKKRVEDVFENMRLVLTVLTKTGVLTELGNEKTE